MELDDRELETETFSNRDGWTAVRVTHHPTSTVAERLRTETLRSAVQAQRECIEEIHRRVREGGGPVEDEPVSRAEFRALEARVARLEKAVTLGEGA
jgi:hypothetical protein